MTAIGYYQDMTLKERNTFFKIGVCVAALALAAVAASSAVIFRVDPPAYPVAVEGAVQRPYGLMLNFLRPSAYGVFASIIISALYALASLIYIYRFFEKTQSPEILYVGFFALSFAFEVCRVMIPLANVNELAGIYVVIAARTLFFGRYLGLFSLLTAGLYASDFNTQEQKYTIVILVSVSLMFAVEAPIDGFSWNTALNVTNGYSKLFKTIEISVAAITLASFLMSALTRGSNMYLFISIGIFLAFMGRGFLLNADTWIAPILGALFLGIGTWLVSDKLHSVYLWL
ncbi:MAG: hypothetical protein LBH85_00310 [Treponema sp.]|jgi:hypothetical protein|nr:hypothetical protein [Treponema sp.]